MFLSGIRMSRKLQLARPQSHTNWSRELILDTVRQGQAFAARKPPVVPLGKGDGVSASLRARLGNTIDPIDNRQSAIDNWKSAIGNRTSGRRCVLVAR